MPKLDKELMKRAEALGIDSQKAFKIALGQAPLPPELSGTQKPAPPKKHMLVKEKEPEKVVAVSGGPAGKSKRGRPPKGKVAMTPAEKQRAYRLRKKGICE